MPHNNFYTKMFVYDPSSTREFVKNGPRLHGFGSLISLPEFVTDAAIRGCFVLDMAVHAGIHAR